MKNIEYSVLRDIINSATTNTLNSTTRMTPFIRESFVKIYVCNALKYYNIKVSRSVKKRLFRIVLLNALRKQTDHPQ